jgi:Na+/H+ antiporter NhaD/arsenite permease-like protein
MGKIVLVILSLIFSETVFAASDSTMPMLATSAIGIFSLIVFSIGYYFVATEDKYHIDKAKPALFTGTFLFIAIAVYYAFNGYNLDALHTEVEHLILEIAEIFFFLFVAMTFIESLVHLRVFDSLRYKLLTRGYTYKKLFWMTGVMAFFLSPVADNLTTALILATVLKTIDPHNRKFLVLGAINIVVAANSGGAWSPFGDVTTLMAWNAGKGTFTDFMYLFPSAFAGFAVTAVLLSLFVQDGKPAFDIQTAVRPEMAKGAIPVVYLGIFTIAMAVVSHQFLHLPAMWGMLFGLSLLKLYSFRLKKKYKSDFNVFDSISKIENNTLLFFFGILAAVGALQVLGWLKLFSELYHPSNLGPTITNIIVGFVSALIDNVPVMYAILKANPIMDHAQWMLVTLTAGIGGSMVAFGSAAGVGMMGKLKDVYTFSSHMKYAWTVLLGYIVSVLVWYVQFQIFGIGA